MITCQWRGGRELERMRNQSPLARPRAAARSARAPKPPALQLSRSQERGAGPHNAQPYTTALFFHTLVSCLPACLPAACLRGPAAAVCRRPPPLRAGCVRPAPWWSCALAAPGCRRPPGAAMDWSVKSMLQETLRCLQVRAAGTLLRHISCGLGHRTACELTLVWKISTNPTRTQTLRCTAGKLLAH